MVRVVSYVWVMPLQKLVLLSVDGASCELCVGDAIAKVGALYKC
ncbi:hypothetical protein Gromo_00188 [Candidatus Gromoviella agglomerans]|nr:hypothetical protein Gromo_00188 [Candidatus Gromoviella agglomerans]